MLADIGPIIFPFPNQGLGGSHMSTFLLAAGLQQCGTSVIIVTPQGTKAEAEARRRMLPVVTERLAPKANDAFAGGIATDLLGLPERVRLLRSVGKGAIVHCSDSWIVQGWGLAATAVGVPIILHQRTFVKGRLLDRLRCKLADRVISISDVCAENFLCEMGAHYRNKLDVITNPFAGSELFTSDVADESQNDSVNPSPHIGFIGNFERRKRPDFFIEVAAFVRKQWVNAKFSMFGADAYFSQISLEQKSLALNIADTISFPGFRTPPEKNYQGLDLLVAPALAEPFGRTLLEAVLSGTPYLAADDGGHHEIYQKWGGGKLVPKESSVQEFAAAVCDALPNLASIRLSDKRIKQLRVELSPARHAEKVLSIYRLLNRKA